MFKVFSTAAAALAASTLVSAQTFTDCNPLEKTCPADSAFGKNKVSCDFTKGACDAFNELPGTTLKYDGEGAHFEILQESNAPTIATEKYIFFGRLDVEVQAAAGQGIVTSLVLQSDDLDEIDWEWVGGDDAQVQTNYFYKGDTTTYDRGAYHPVAAPLTSTHKYSVEWTKAAVTWLIDDNPVRTLTAASAAGGKNYPQTPMQVKLGTWCAGGKNTAKGTVEWAGGYTDFSKAPFTAYYKSVSIVDYAGGDGPTDQSIKEYVYGDKTGSWESIKVVTGDASDDETTTSKTSSKTTASEEQTKTKSEESKETSESAKETKTTASTTMSTAASTTATPLASSTTAAAKASSPVATSAEATVSTVPESAASRMSGMAVAAAGLFLAQLLI